MKKENIYRISAYVGRYWDKNKLFVMEYDGFDPVVKLYLPEDEDDDSKQIWLDLNCLTEMAKEIQEFANVLNTLGLLKNDSKKT